VWVLISPTLTGVGTEGAEWPNWTKSVLPTKHADTKTRHLCSLFWCRI